MKKTVQNFRICDALSGLVDLYNLKNVKNTHGGLLILVKLRASACNFTKINTPPWVFFTFFKLYKWYQIAQRTTYAFDEILGLIQDDMTKKTQTCCKNTIFGYGWR